MHCVVLCVLGLLALGCVVGPVSGRAASFHLGTIYLPDQMEYIRAWTTTCQSEDLVYWPQDKRCYPESSQGPCFVSEVLLLDRRRYVPYCALKSAITTPLTEETPVLSHGVKVN